MASDDKMSALEWFLLSNVGELGGLGMAAYSLFE